MTRKDPQQQQNQQSPKKKSQKNNDDLSSFARYSGMAFQMIVIIGIMTYVGIKLDERTESETPLFTAILSLLGVIVALYTSLKDFIHKK